MKSSGVDGLLIDFNSSLRFCNMQRLPRVQPNILPQESRSIDAMESFIKRLYANKDSLPEEASLLSSASTPSYNKNESDTEDVGSYDASDHSDHLHDRPRGMEEPVLSRVD